MFDSLLGSKFSNKCKHAVKCINTRAVPIFRKKQANVAYLRQVVANLLAGGEEDEAFRRMDDLIIEINLTACYDIIQSYCGLILSQLQELQKQRECAQEALEAMATIIFAAARFPDLPELSDLRRVFTERYGGHIVSPVNAEFVEKFQMKSFSKEKKLQLMQSIANEFSVRWDSNEFGRKQSHGPSAIPYKPKKSQLRHNRDEASITLATELKDEAAVKGRKWPPTNVVLRQQRQMEPKDIHVVSTTEAGPSEAPMKIKEVADYKLENVKPYQSNRAVPPYGHTRHSDHGTYKDGLKDGHAQEKLWEVQGGLGPSRSMPDKQGHQAKSVDKPYNKAPPYTQINEIGNKNHMENVKGNGFAPYMKSHESMNGYTAKERSIHDLEHETIRRHEERLDPEIEQKKPVKPTNSNGRVPYLIPPYVKPNVKDLSVQNARKEQSSDVADYGTEGKCDTKEGTFGDEKPKPVSVRSKFSMKPDISIEDNALNGKNLNSHTPGARRRHSSRWAAGGYDDNGGEAKMPNRELREEADDEIDNAIDFGKLLHRPSSDRRRHASRSATTVKHDEEVVMDRLLMHLSMKGKAPETGKERRKAKTHSVEHVADQLSEDHRDDGSWESKQPAGRTFSLPAEPVKPDAPLRSNSMQPDLVSPRGGRVHPRMPEYDQLAARFTGLKKI